MGSACFCCVNVLNTFSGRLTCFELLYNHVMLGNVNQSAWDLNGFFLLNTRFDTLVSGGTISHIFWLGYIVLNVEMGTQMQIINTNNI